MTVLSAQTLRRIATPDPTDETILRPIVDPFVERQHHEPTGTSFGLSACGYDVRMDQDLRLFRGRFELASTMERFCMPRNVVGIVHDKSTWARRGIAVQNTVIEPGWCGYLTLELTNHGEHYLWLPRGTPIAQIVFHRLDEPTDQPYTGKYQNQEQGPQFAR